MWAQIMIEKARGNNVRATELAKAFCGDFGKYGLEIERYYDHGLVCRVLEHITRPPEALFWIKYITKLPRVIRGAPE